MLRTKRRLVGGFALTGVLAVFMVSGCATAPKDFDPKVTGPQLIVEPETISLGVATLKDTPLMFRGKGFKPGDSVFISLMGVKKDDKTVDLPIADADVGKEGGFKAVVSTQVKVTEILRADLGSNEKMETIIIVKQPPIPEGTYTVRAVSMGSDKKAETKLTAEVPGFMDKGKDSIGESLGKIVVRKK